MAFSSADLSAGPPRVPPKQASVYLHDKHGISIAASTLAKRRVDGEGPAYRKMQGGRILYDLADLDRWASKTLSAQLRSTSESHLKPPASTKFNSTAAEYP